MTFETRTVSATFEVREEAAGPIFEGYAVVFDTPYDMGPFWEQVDKRAFNRTLGTNPDVRLLIDHEGQPLARTKSGTLQLSVDDKGLLARAGLEPSDPDVQRLIPKMKRGDLSEMSFAFRVAPGGDEWDYDTPQGAMRTLRELSLAGGDVSVVTYAASPTTTASLRSRDLLEARCVFAEQMVREIRAGRALSQENIDKLQQVLRQLADGDEADDAGPAVTVLEKAAELIAEDAADAETSAPRNLTPETVKRLAAIRVA